MVNKNKILQYKHECYESFQVLVHRGNSLFENGPFLGQKNCTITKKVLFSDN